MRRSGWWTVPLVLLLLAGCRRPAGQVVSPPGVSSTPAAVPGPVQVLTDPEALTDARALAAGRKESDRTDEDASLLLFADSPVGFAQLQKERARIVPLLRARLGNRDASKLWQRSEAAFILLRLNDPEGTSVARALLKDTAARAPVLSQFSKLSPGEFTKLPGAEVVVLGSLEATDVAVRRNAFRAADRCGSPAVTRRLLELLRAGQDPEGLSASTLVWAPLRGNSSISA